MTITHEPEPLPVLTEEEAKTAKNPPPIPKVRRGWRTRKSRDSSDDGKEPGKFSSRMPSIDTKTAAGPFSSPEDNSVPEDSPFSPTKGKTLDPLQSNSTDSPTTIVTAPEKRSVRTAVNEAQEIAVQAVEQCLENTHLHENPALPQQSALERSPPPPPPNPPNPHITVNGEALPIQRTVLAPPGQAPIRAVPGPRLEVERSPFLSDDEISQDPESATTSRKPSNADNETDGMGLGIGLSRKDSWEDFGD